MNPKFTKFIIPGVSACVLALASINVTASDYHVRSGSGGKVVGDYDGCVKSIGGNAQVCEKDHDGDGVLNNSDKCPTTPAGATVDSDGCMLKLTLNNIHFAVNKYNLNDQARATLDPIINVLKGRPDIKGLTVTGHTDSDGSAKRNQALSENRAQSVANYFKAGGVAVDVAAKGMGETQPVASNATEAGKAQNRRVELGVIKK